MTVSISNLNFTWANSSNVFTAIGANVNAASYAADSRVFRLAVNGNDIFDITANGDVTCNTITVAANILSSNILSIVTLSANTITALTVKTSVTTVNSLPSAASVGAGTRAFVNDANQNSFYANVFFGGSFNVPVFSDGTRWKIG